MLLEQWYKPDLLSFNLHYKGTDLRTGSIQQAKPAIAQQPPEGSQTAPAISESWEAIGVLVAAEKGIKHVGRATVKWESTCMQQYL